MRKLLNPVCIAIGLSFPGLAQAQATANAITGASDAFGFRKGDETVGIYDETSARGFNLEAAGNYRFHGNYFVRNSGVSSFFLDSTTVRIGFNTLPLMFPSPSGVVDYSLRDPRRDEPSLFTVGIDAFVQPYVEAHLKHRTNDDRASGSFGVSFVPEVKDPQGGSGGQSFLIAGTARLSTGNANFQLFGGEYRYERPSQFRVVTSGPLVEREMRRSDFIGITGLNDTGQRRIAGSLTNVRFGRKWDVGLTTVFSQEDPSRSQLLLFDDLRDDGAVRARIIASPAQRITSISNELRVGWIHERNSDFAHRADIVARHRRTRSSFGGATTFDLGRHSFGSKLEGDPAEFVAEGEAGLRDRITQIGAGIAYRAVLGRMRINGGLIRTNYRKSVSGEGVASDPLDTSSWLYNLSAAYRVGPWLEVYGGLSQGLEEAGVAPASAPNRYEVLAPASAEQRELALILKPAAAFKLVLGAFDLERGYFGADGIGGPYRMLGRVRHRGLEASAAGKVLDGLNVVVGGVLIDPEVTARFDGENVSFRPVGVPRLRFLASADYQLPRSRVHFDGSIQFTGSRPAVRNADGTIEWVQPSWTANVGVRAPVEFGSLRSTVRFQLFNLFGNYTWDPTSAGTMTFSPSRRFRLVVTSEF